MAGLDKEWNGEAWLADGATRGYLQQEPELDPALNVMGNVMEGVAHKKAILDQYNALMADYNDENAEKAGKLQDVIDSQNLWDLEAQVEQAMDAMRCPPGEASIDNPRRAAWRSRSCCASPIAMNPPTISRQRERRASFGRYAGPFSLSPMTAISSTT